MWRVGSSRVGCPTGTDKGPRSVLPRPAVLGKRRGPDGHPSTHAPLHPCHGWSDRVEVRDQVHWAAPRPRIATQRLKAQMPAPAQREPPPLSVSPAPWCPLLPLPAVGSCDPDAHPVPTPAPGAGPRPSCQPGRRCPRDDFADIRFSGAWPGFQKREKEAHTQGSALTSAGQEAGPRGHVV